MDDDPIFQPLQFRNLSVKNRIIRSSISGRFDNYDGSGNPTRINWELKFARAGVGAIISALVPVEPRGANVPGYAFIDRDESIPFWRELTRRVHEHDCKYIVQLAHAGRQRDIHNQYLVGLSSTDKADRVHGFPCRRMTVEQIKRTVRLFADGARRAREAGVDGVEIHGAHGYLITQFLSSAINDRTDEYGGSLRNRARFLLEIIGAIRAAVGDDYHVQVKISATEYANLVFPWEDKGNTIEDSVEVCRWMEEAGVDAVHVSTGSAFPHPRMPPGSFEVKDAVKTYHTMLGSGKHVLRNYFIFRTWPLNQVFQRHWDGLRGDRVEGINLPDSRRIKSAVGIPVLCTGGFQTASVIRAAITDGSCDAVTIARPLIANEDLVRMFERGLDRPPNPCTYSNECLFNVLEYPLACYDQRRFGSRAEMLQRAMSVYDPPPFHDEERAQDAPAAEASPATASRRSRRPKSAGR